VAIKVVDNTDKVLQAFKTAVGAGLNVIGMEAAGYTQDNTPVRTGNLANSVDWKTKEDEKAVYVGFSKEKTTTDVKYAIFVEEGSVNNVAHHMLRRAATEHNEEYKKIMEDAMKNA
jgi:HK97 gp10 family phage protein